MKEYNLINELVDSLEKVYYMEAFTNLTEFLQGENYILLYMLQNPKVETSPSALSEILHMTRPRVTTIINTLKKKNYVETEQNEDDRRRLTVRITENGINFIVDKQKNAMEYFQLFIDSVGEENTKDLIRIIDLAVKKMDGKTKFQGE
ncbi:MAG: MarR family transcriptional regulator [Tissierella sp.]|nr:MarR family transcriptional regulator [Tissierella sp.]